MDPVVFESVLSSAYTGQLSIVHDDIVNYVTVASFLQMWHIVDKCTEILKRPRSSAEPPAAPPGSASRQQSPSSTDCLYAEREGRRRERRLDALPPLATWRRPQQLGRWGRPRPPSELHSADSQNYPCCEGAWPSNQAKSSPSGPDRAGRSADASKLKLKRPVDRRRDGDENEDRRRDQRGAEADEGVCDEEEEEEEERGTQMGENHTNLLDLKLQVLEVLSMFEPVCGSGPLDHQTWTNEVQFLKSFCSLCRLPPS